MVGLYQQSASFLDNSARGKDGLSYTVTSQLHARAMTHLRDVLGETEHSAEDVKLAA